MEPTLKPTRKIVVGAAAGGMVAFITWLIEAFHGPTMTASAAVGLSALITFAIQYWIPNAE